MTRNSYLFSTLAVVLIAHPLVCQGFFLPSTSAVANPFRGNVAVKVTPTDFSANGVASSNTINLIQAGMASSSMTVAETEAWVQPMSLVLGPIFSLLSFGMLCRIVLSWYPTANVNELPFNLVVWPTEPFLRLVRGSVPPAFGVDITPVVWLGIFTFLNEILLGQQGLLTMKLKYGI